MTSSRHHSHFPIHHFVLTCMCIAKKLQGVCGHSTYQKLLHYWLCPFYRLEPHVRDRCWVMAPNVHRSLFLICNLHVRNPSIENWRSYMDILHFEQLLYYWRHTLCGFELDQRSDWRATAPDMHQLFSDTTLSCIYFKPVHALLFVAQLHVCMTTKLTYLMTGYYTPNNALHGFIRTVLASCTTCCTIFQLLHTYMHVCLY